jgi:hypothetical protein
MLANVFRITIPKKIGAQQLVFTAGRRVATNAKFVVHGTEKIDKRDAQPASCESYITTLIG